MNIHPFVKELASIKLERCFNPYSDRCEIHDHDNAPQLRALALSAIIRRAESLPIDAIWIGRDLGYRGGRRTGLALTDDAHISQHAKRWDLEASRPTSSYMVTERTASVIWSKLSQINTNIFLWNVFPLHPHEQDQPFTNRQHNALERKQGEEVLKQLITLLKPQRIIAIGNDAARSASLMTGTIQTYKVRHPSYGGHIEFSNQISELYKL